MGLLRATLQVFRGSMIALSALRTLRARTTVLGTVSHPQSAWQPYPDLVAGAESPLPQRPFHSNSREARQHSSGQSGGDRDAPPWPKMPPGGPMAVARRLSRGAQVPAPMADGHSACASCRGILSSAKSSCSDLIRTTSCWEHESPFWWEEGRLSSSTQPLASRRSWAAARGMQHNCRASTPPPSSLVRHASAHGITTPPDASLRDLAIPSRTASAKERCRMRFHRHGL